MFVDNSPRNWPRIPHQPVIEMWKERLQLGWYAKEKHLYKSPSSFGLIYASIWLLLYFYWARVPSLLAPLGHIRPGSCYMLQHIQFDSSTRRWKYCGYFAANKQTGTFLLWLSRHVSVTSDHPPSEPWSSCHVRITALSRCSDEFCSVVQMYF